MAMRRGSGGLTERVAFDAPRAETDVYGGTEDGWQPAALALVRWAAFIYQRGEEDVQGDRLTGSSRFKVRIQQSAAARAITTDYRMRDLRRGTAYQLREIDAVTDDQWIYLVVESGVAL